MTIRLLKVGDTLQGFRYDLEIERVKAVNRGRRVSRRLRMERRKKRRGELRHLCLSKTSPYRFRFGMLIIYRINAIKNKILSISLTALGSELPPEHKTRRRTSLRLAL
jgi:hypothetical protein